MPQTLVVCRSQEDLCAHLLSGVAVVHDLETTLLVSCVLEQLRNLIDSDVRKGCGITFSSGDGADLGKQTLDQMGNCHTRWNSVRVDDQIRCYTISCKRHILMPVCDTNGSLLSVTRREFVTNLGYLRCSCTNLDETQTLCVRSKKNLIDDTVLRAAQGRRHVALGV